MKSVMIIAICLVSLVLVQCQTGRKESTTINTGSTTVEISENEKTLKLEASFNKGKTMDVYRYINSSIAPSSLFSSEDDDLDVTTSLQDGTTFQIKAYRGELTLTFDKRSNTRKGYERVKELCEGVKEVVL